MPNNETTDLVTEIAGVPHVKAESLANVPGGIYGLNDARINGPAAIAKKLREQQDKNTSTNGELP